jgi:cyclopropane fatty-acyl-phospholipid synthase-like methyltransferase
VPLESTLRVLDFGCGFGFGAKMLAPQVGEIFVWDASANMRRHARRHLVGCRNVRFLDLFDSRIQPRVIKFDLILVNSVVQYMSPEEFSAWLLRWQNMLAPRGRIVVSDLIPPDYLAICDIVDFLKFSVRRGFVASAIWYAMSQVRYWRVRNLCPLSRIGHEELSWKGKDAGLSVSYLTQNLTYFTKRITAVFSHITA